MDFTDYTVIDAHTHIGHVREDEPPMTVDQMLTWMDRHHIDQIVLLPLESPEASSFYIPTSRTLDIASNHPDRFVPFCCVDPRMNVIDYPDAFEERIQTYVERGARGFGEVKVGLPIDDPRMKLLYGIAGSYDLPVLFHMDSKRGTDEIGLTGLESVLEEFPETDFIAHAPGWWAHMSGDVTQMGGYPDGPIKSDGRCSELLSVYDNLYADISAMSGWNALVRDLSYGQSFLEEYHERLMWATDYLHPTQETPQVEILETFDLTEEMAENIFHTNIERVLR